jgi:hypothetical protein
MLTQAVFKLRLWLAWEHQEQCVVCVKQLMVNMDLKFIKNNQQND